MRDLWIGIAVVGGAGVLLGLLIGLAIGVRL